MPPSSSTAALLLHDSLLLNRRLPPSIKESTIVVAECQMVLLVSCKHSLIVISLFKERNLYTLESCVLPR
ncbi:hypothetical protein HanXRQr2_Chr06g0239751 [Helianthus annuus]|uniref:Uncharacterized protein n=1 Tax=Helianthus annuus TaxID=4232 RepID=A0A251UET4_HELAN|nr:hypothetical protein HanXRQr2_Chr06g0239751 [Helianthus annuus]